MNTALLRNLCETGCTVSEISAHLLQSPTITPQTVRKKGQFAMQRLFYVRGGRTKFVLDDGREILCQKGDIVYLPPDVTYFSVWEPSEENAAVLLRFDLYANGESALLDDKLSIIARDVGGRHLERFLQLAETFRRGGVGYRLKCQALLTDILYTLITEALNAGWQSKKNAVYRGVMYIENHYLEEIDINALASMCSLCPSAFRSHFRKVTEMSPVQYKNHLIAKRAAELLQTEELGVSEVAQTLGIRDIYYFNRMFKKAYGIPPGRYRAKLLNVSEDEREE